MADPNLLASIIAGQDPLSPQMLQGYQGAQLSAAANSPTGYEGLAGLARILAGSTGRDMLNSAVQNTTQARLAAQPDMARLMASPNAYQDLAQNPQGFNPIATSNFLNRSPQQAQEYQLGQQQTTEAALKNLAGVSLARSQAAALQQPQPTLESIRTGRYQGPDYERAFRALSGGATGGTGAAPSASSAAIVQPVTATLTKLGYSPIDQAAVLGNAAFESQLNPANTSGDGGTSIGMWQWHSPERKAGLQQFAAANGQSWTDPSVQAAYMDKELRQRAPEFFDPNKTLAEKTKIFQDKFEVPGADTSGARTRLAQNFAGQQAGTDALAAVSPNSVAARRPDLAAANATANAMYDRGAPPQPPTGVDALAAVGQSPPSSSQTAQASGGTTTGAGGAAGAPSTMPAAMTAGDALRQQALMTALGAKIPEPVQDYLSAMMIPPGPARDAGVAAAYNKAGIKPFIGGERRGSPIFRFNPATNSYDLAVQNPQLPEGAIEGPGGNISMAPGALPTITSVAAARAGGTGTYEPHIYADRWGNPIQGTKAQAPQFANPAPGGTPQQAAPAVPGQLSAGGAIPGRMPAPPPLPSPPAPPPQPQQTPYGGAPSFLANTPTGQKDISQVHINDMFPGGAGIPQPGGPAGPPTELQKEIQKDDAERLAGYNKEQAGNQQVNQDLLRLHGVLGRGFITSNAAQIGSELANIAHGIGADWAYPRGWAPANAAEMSKASTDLVFAALKTLPGQVKVAEITGLQKANPSISIPVETNYQIMNDILARSKWQDERARLATEFTVTNKGVPLSVFDSAYNRMASLPDVANEYMGILRQHGAVFPEDVRAGGGPGPQYMEGQTATHPGTGKRLIFHNGQGWVPLQ